MFRLIENKERTMFACVLQRNFDRIPWDAWDRESFFNAFDAKIGQNHETIEKGEDFIMRI